MRINFMRLIFGYIKLFYDEYSLFNEYYSKKTAVRKAVRKTRTDWSNLKMILIFNFNYSVAKN